MSQPKPNSHPIDQELKRAAADVGIHLTGNDFQPGTDPGLAIVRFDAGGATTLNPNPVLPQWLDPAASHDNGGDLYVLWILDVAHRLDTWNADIVNVAPFRDADVTDPATPPYLNGLESGALVGSDNFHLGWYWKWNWPSGKTDDKYTVQYDAFIDYSLAFQTLNAPGGGSTSLGRLITVDPTIYLPPDK